VSAPAKPETRTRVTLRWRDMDMLGHLNQSVYHELLEEGRAELLSGVAREAGDAYGTWVLVHVELDYRHEVRKDHREVEVVVRAGDVGRTSVVFEHEVLLPDGTVAASGRTVMVGWDARARGKRELTGAERAALGA
jgi:acyl-CoA thioester hydrolase